ncbi:MAG TPA: hypothetical protein VM865_08260, partial [Acidobacteriaceae bacterium]|nr:hypothetical protein [Acidobacteriaceae bacterium]
GSTGKAEAARGVVFLSAAGGGKGGAGRERGGRSGADGPGGAVQRIVLSGDVRLDQTGRTGRGEQLLYTAGTGDFVLTGSPGHPPEVKDERQGSVRGATLMFGAADSTIIVAGEPASHGQARGRVRTETQIP